MWKSGERFLLILLLGAWLFALGAAAPAWAGDDWKPITPEELALKDDPLRPGAHAVILYREVYSNHEKNYEENYTRLKVLTEEGKKYADVEIPYLKGTSGVRDLEARTIRPDGSIVPFTGEVFEKTVVKYKRTKVLAKTFTFPEVEVGSILEYRYRSTWDQNLLIAPDWDIQGELSLLRGSFRVMPYSGPYSKVTLHWLTRWLPDGKQLEEQKDYSWALELEDVPAFHEEEYMPPKAPLKMAVLFYYKEPKEELNEEYWKRSGEEKRKDLDHFVGNHKEIRQEVATLTAPADPPQEKLRKLFARAQQIRNLSFERSKTEKEEKREKLKDNNNVKDVLKRGYGYGGEINRLFIAFARAAGYEATLTYLVSRDRDVFTPALRRWYQFNDNVVWVKAGETEYYLDPGGPYTPFGALAWEQTGVQGVRLDKEGGTIVTTPEVRSADAALERQATLHLDADGNLQGRVTLTFLGLEASDHRYDGLFDDDEKRRKDLKEEIEGWLPTGARVELESVSDWENPEEPLRVEFTLEVPDYAAATGRRLLLPTGIFHSTEKYPFQHAEREHPIYFSYPWKETDEVELELPPGYAVEALPAEKQVPTNAMRYSASCRQEEHAIHLQRALVVDANFFQRQDYYLLRRFFSQVREGDEQSVVLENTQMGQRQ
jgi:hypothetical protein